MRKTLLGALLGSIMAASAWASGGYKELPPSDDPQYAACVTWSNTTYTGGDEWSPVRGLTKAQAYCACLWNETPPDFKGGLARLAESAHGRRLKAMCERRANWE